MQNQTPVTDYKKTKGLIYFARMLDKIRLHAAGRLAPGYFVGVEDPTFFDSRCTRFLEVDYDELKKRTLRVAWTRRFWTGASSVAESRAKKKLRSGMLSWPNGDGGTKAAPI